MFKIKEDITLQKERSFPQAPRLRTANKVPAPYPLGKFPAGFVSSLGKQVVYLLATKPKPSLQGEEWEAMFARAVGAEWKPSNVGLDDVVLKNCAWGAKTTKHTNPWNTKRVRLISGRNSPVFSYGVALDTSSDPNMLGEAVLGIWNTRVDDIRSRYEHARTVVMLKSNDLLKLAIFEIETVRYPPDLYEWRWNKNGNIEGFRDNKHCFTWQPHGSQFTIIEDVPESKLCLQIKKPKRVSEKGVLEDVGYHDGWIQLVDPSQT